MLFPGGYAAIILLSRRICVGEYWRCSVDVGYVAGISCVRLVNRVSVMARMYGCGVDDA